MRGDIVYRVYGLHEGREEDCYFGAFRSRSEAHDIALGMPASSKRSAIRRSALSCSFGEAAQFGITQGYWPSKGTRLFAERVSCFLLQQTRIELYSRRGPTGHREASYSLS